MAQERAPVGEAELIAEELQAAGSMQLEQACQEKPLEQLAENPDRQQEGRT